MKRALAYDDLLDPATKRDDWNDAQKTVVRWAMGLLGQIKSAKKTKAVRKNALKSWTAEARALREVNRALRKAQERRENGTQAMRQAITRATAKGAK